jgi:hypothetical protein
VFTISYLIFLKSKVAKPIRLPVRLPVAGSVADFLARSKVTGLAAATAVYSHRGASPKFEFFRNSNSFVSRIQSVLRTRF